MIGTHFPAMDSASDEDLLLRLTEPVISRDLRPCMVPIVNGVLSLLFGSFPATCDQSSLYFLCSGFVLFLYFFCTRFLFYSFPFFLFFGVCMRSRLDDSSAMA